MPSYLPPYLKAIEPALSEHARCNRYEEFLNDMLLEVSINALGMLIIRSLCLDVCVCTGWWDLLTTNDTTRTNTSFPTNFV